MTGLRARLRDYTIYVAVGLSLSFITYWCAIHKIGDADSFARWGGLVVSTAGLAALFTGPGRKACSSRRYTVVLTAVLSLRVVIVGSVLWYFLANSNIRYVILLPVEWLIINALLKRFGTPCRISANHNVE